MEGLEALRKNGLLGQLPGDVLAPLAAQACLIDIPARTVLQRPRVPLTHAYFPIGGLAASVATTAAGKAIEFTMTGRDAMLGATLCLRGGPMAVTSTALVEMKALRVTAQAVLAAWERSELFRRLASICIQVMLDDAIRVALCSQHHGVEQQLARWLLVAADRLHARRIAVTHAVIAGQLGVRREGVTEALGRLQARGLVARSRGGIELADVPGLERAACDCHEAMTLGMRALRSPGTAPASGGGA